MLVYSIGEKVKQRKGLKKNEDGQYDDDDDGENKRTGFILQTLHCILFL
jgi:hypothetical protein